ncbi:unnamed protein product [Caenorhabditis angaria]|uniref:Uncharacterized protein n=1 Tax=Caenorhabditis angaria TaxID=860376 RepID=A0A9P1IC95_9PELO|nr:unnamed protein product [Caenorhabditis angaria]
MSQVYIVELEERCSPAPSTSGSSSHSGAGSPMGSESSSASPTRRRVHKKRSSQPHFLGERRRIRKTPACRVKHAKKLASASKLRLWKNKIEKEHKKRLEQHVKNLERLERRREMLHSGQSEIAIICDTVTENARSLRASYERQQAVLYQTLIATAISSTNLQSNQSQTYYFY